MDYKEQTQDLNMTPEQQAFNDEINRVKSNMYMKPGEDQIYSKERGLGPVMAAKRLEKKGVDIPGLVGNRMRENPDEYKKGGAINLKDCKISTHVKNSKHKENW